LLCSSAILLENGQAKMRGLPEAVIGKYLSSSGSTMLAREWSTSDAPGDHYFRLLRIEILQNGALAGENVSTGSPLQVKIRFVVESPTPILQVGFELETLDGIILFQSYHTDGDETTVLEPGVHCLVCTIPAGVLNAGMYVIRPMAALYFTRWLLSRGASTELRFQATFDHSKSNLWTFTRAGVIAPYLHWGRDEDEKEI
jgi:hypothetical protein